jgi:hypothetical protein
MVRFSYKALQAYYAARYLQGAPMALLEDITATLGRYSRMRQWEDVFIKLAGVQKKLEDRLRLLHVLLAGSSLVEGEQAFLAVRMDVEMADCRWDPATRNQVREFRQELVQSKVVARFSTPSSGAPVPTSPDRIATAARRPSASPRCVIPMPSVI